MKNFKSYISENYDVYLDMPHNKKFRALVKMTDKEGKEHNFPIGSDDNVRSAAHKVIKGLTDKGFKLKDVEYEF
jgi:hypothetical protein